MSDTERGLVVQIGELFGQSARAQDDGGIAEDVLCVKVPELVERLRLERDALLREHEAVDSLPPPVDDYCPGCAAYRAEPHKVDCPIAAFYRAHDEATRVLAQVPIL